MLRLSWLTLSVLASATLVSCGGGGGGGGATTDPARPMVLAGVVAIGDALAGATVEARCRGGGSGSAASAADGRYSITMGEGSSLPCVIRATAAGGATVLHSVAIGGSTAHVTPASQLIVGSLAGEDPATYYARFDNTVAAALTTSQVDAAHTRVVADLSEGGLDFSAFGNLLTAPLVAANGASTGNAFDQALDALAQRLTAQGLTLGDFTDAVVRASPANSTPSVNTASLPPQSLLQVASPSCSALRSGRYRLVSLKPAAVGLFSTELITIDAPAGTATDAEGDTGTFTSTGSECQFGSDNGQFVVSQAGVIVMRTVEDGVWRLGLGFPEQRHALADLVGDFQALGFERGEGVATFTTNSAVATFSAGVISFTSFCDPVATCVPVSDTRLTLTVNPAGGFDVANPGDASDRLFAYRAGDGELMLIDLAGNGSFGIWTPPRASLPLAVGATQDSWGMSMGPTQVSPRVMAVNRYRVTASTATSWTRESVADGHSETLQLNVPRTGWSTRPEGNAALPGGGTVLVRPFEAMPVRGMGMSLLSMPTLDGGSYFFSVGLP